MKSIWLFFVCVLARREESVFMLLGSTITAGNECTLQFFKLHLIEFSIMLYRINRKAEVIDKTGHKVLFIFAVVASFISNYPFFPGVFT